MSLSLFLIGVLSLLCQVVLLRELNVAFYGVELVYLLALTSWMLGTAAGAALAPHRDGPGRDRLGPLLVAVPILLPLAIVGIRGSRRWLGGLPGAYLPFDHQLLVLLLATLPLSILLGIAFSRAAARSLREGRSLGRAYGVESAGFAAAGAATTLAFHLGAQTFAVAVTGAGLSALAILLHAGRRRRVRAWLIGPAAAAFAWLLASAGTIDRQLTSWNHPGLVATSDSPYGRITRVSSESQVAVFENDVLAFESGGVEQENLAHLTALQHPRPGRILVLGGAVRRLQDELALHGPSQLTVVEQDPVLARTDARAKVVLADPRKFLRAPGLYDLIVVGAGAPDSGLSNRFYTREFFEACAARLAPGGVLGLALPVPDGFLTPHALRCAASIVAALDAALPHVEVLPGTSTIAVASPRPLPADEGVPISRLQERGLHPRLVRAPYLRYVYTSERRHSLPGRLRTAGVPPNTDARPVCYQYALLIWLARFFPPVQNFDIPAVRPAGTLVWSALAAVAFVAIVRLGRAWRAGALALVAGFTGMVLETVVLLRFQASRGALYVDIGLLVTAFMAGLSVGAWGAGRTVDLHREGLRRIATRAVLLALASAAAFAAVAGDLAAGSLAAAALALAAIGVLVGALFGFAAARRPLGERGAGRLYALDVLGGAAGSLAATVLLVPLAGLGATAWLVAVVALAALALP